MSKQPDSPLGRLLVTTAIGWALYEYPPSPSGAYAYHDPLHLALWSFGALLVAIGVVKSLPPVGRGLGRLFKLIRAAGPDQSQGSAGFMSPKELRRAGLHRYRRGARFIGTVGRHPLWLRTETAHLILGPSGTQKTSAAIINILMGNGESALINDIKGELWETTHEYRARRFGHKCVKIDPKDPSNSARINPLDLIAANVEANDPRALTRARGMALQLHPDPQGGGGQNEVFYKGARILIVTVIFAVIVVLPPEHRNLAMVYRVLSDLDVLDDLLAAASKSHALNGEIADMARNTHTTAFGDGGNAKTFDSFRLNALQALEAFGPGNYLAAITSDTTFLFAELKTSRCSAYIMIDFANSDVLAQFSGLLQWLAVDAMVEAGNNKPVMFVLDEFCNAPLHILPKVLTLLRSSGVQVILATQDLDDIIRVYSKHALETVLSETHKKQILGGIRSKATLEYFSSYLGEYSERSSSFSMGRDDIGESVSRSARRVLSEDELRRLPDDAQIVFYGHHRPILAKKVQVFAVSPWRHQVGVNTAYGSKRKFLPIDVEMGWLGARVTPRARRAYRRLQSRVQGRRSGMLVHWLGQLGGLLAPGAAIGGLVLLVLIAMQDIGLPNLRWEYAHTVAPSSSARPSPSSFVWCRYIGPSSPGTVWQDDCPLILWRKPE